MLCAFWMDSIRLKEHLMQCGFLQTVVEKINVEEIHYIEFVVQYSDNSVDEFYLKTYSTKGEVLNAIKIMKHKGEQITRQQVFTSSSGR